MSPGRSRVLFALLLLAACRTTAPPAALRSPDPLRPPLVGAPLTEAQALSAHAAVAAAEAGDVATANEHLGELPLGHPVTRLVALEIRFVRGEDVTKDASVLARQQPGYGSAWALFALAAQRAADWRDVLTATRRLSELQPDDAWQRLATEAQSRLFEASLQEATSLLAHGDAAGALARARRILDEAPDATPARLLAVRAALALGKTRDAADLVPALPDSAEGLELKGRVAGALGEWELAAELFARLPEKSPGRCELLASARDHARFLNAPPYVTDALAAPSVTRRGLAAILVWEVPSLRERATGPVAVYEDVVQAPERGDILVAARTGLITGDPIAHRFSPNRQVKGREFVAVLERLTKAIGRPAPRWCGERSDAGCLEVPAQLDGGTVANLVRQVAGEGGEPCTKR